MSGADLNIRFIGPGETHLLRQMVLRPLQPVDEMEWPGDRAAGSFHAGVELGQVLVGIGTFILEQHAGLPGAKHYRLRGMAVHPGYRSKGIGGMILGFGIDQLRHEEADLVWCNARDMASGFYAKAGFSTVGLPFTIEGIGIHHLMYKRI